jgi:hypothetical protein
MPTLTNSATLAIGAAVPAVEEVSIAVVPAASVATGNGRLVHPTLGTLDYTYAPNAWTNVDGDGARVGLVEDPARRGQHAVDG